MSKRLLAFVVLFTLFLSACPGDEPADEPDVEATVEAAVAATQTAEAAAVTEPDPPPTGTPIPPTPTPELEPTPTPEARVLDLDEETIAFSPEGRNYATDMTFRLVIEDEVVNELVIDGVTNADGDSSITYDFTHAGVAAPVRSVIILTVDDTTYFSLPDGRCVSAGVGDIGLDELVVETGRILLDTDNMVTGRLQWNGVTEVHGIVTDEYLLGVDNLDVDIGITNMTYGVVNVAQEENYIARLVLQGAGSSGVLAPGVPGELYYELNFAPSESPFEIEVPAGCIDLGIGVIGDDEPGDDRDRDETVAEPVDDAEVEIVITQAAQNISHHCQGGNVVIEGMGNNVNLTGTCNEVSVRGNGNNINIESAAAIIVTGTGNNITYSGSPTITDNGLGNVIRRR